MQTSYMWLNKSKENAHEPGKVGSLIMGSWNTTMSPKTDRQEK